MCAAHPAHKCWSSPVLFGFFVVLSTLEGGVKMRRDQIIFRLSRTEVETVHELARRETEGNRSMMLRRLLREAIERRGAVPGAPAQPVPAAVHHD